MPRLRFLKQVGAVALILNMSEDVFEYIHSSCYPLFRPLSKS